MMPFAVSHEVLNRQRARDLRYEAERAQRLQAAPAAKQKNNGMRLPALLARAREAFAWLRHSPARPSINPAG